MADEPLSHLVASPRIILHKLELDGHAAYYTEFTDMIKPHLPVSLRRQPIFLPQKP